jgi:hypothetical protein
MPRPLWHKNCGRGADQTLLVLGQPRMVSAADRAAEDLIGQLRGSATRAPRNVRVPDRLLGKAIAEVSAWLPHAAAASWLPLWLR